VLTGSFSEFHKCSVMIYWPGLQSCPFFSHTSDSRKLDNLIVANLSVT